MANTLSQYIGQIIDRRNQELQQRLAPLIPLLEMSIAEEKNKAEIEKQRQLQINDYSSLLASEYDDETAAEFKAGAQSVQSLQGLGALYNQYAVKMSMGKEIDNNLLVLRSMGVPPDKLEEARQAMLQARDAAGVNSIGKIYAEYGTINDIRVEEKAQQSGVEFYRAYKTAREAGKTPDEAFGVGVTAERDEQRRYNASLKVSGGSGGGSGRSYSGGGETEHKAPYKVTETIRGQIDKAFNPNSLKIKGGGEVIDGYVIMSINGKKTAVPAAIGDDECLYLVGETGIYPIHPSKCLEKDEEKTVAISRKQVDRYNGGGTTNTGLNLKRPSVKDENARGNKSLPPGSWVDK
jgi:hypothetical protein